MQVNLSSWRTSDHYFSVSPVIIMELVRNLKCIVYACITFLEDKQIMAAEKMW